MKLISFDIGIKHMAYCVFDQAHQVIAWDILNLIESDPPPICTEATATKKPCGKKAKYGHGDDRWFCETHAKKATGLRLPSPALKAAALAKAKTDALGELCVECGLDATGSKQVRLERLKQFVATSVLVPVVKPKGNANTANLITLGRTLATALDAMTVLRDVTHVIMENQIGPLAGRMKTLQGMLTQYFILRHPTAHVEFISSANKLKLGQGHADPDPAPGPANTYQQHKRDSVTLTRQMMRDPTWLAHFNDAKTKKDDLADAYLQGVWYHTSRRNSV